MAVGTPAAAEKKAATDKENDDASLTVATLTRTPILITDHVEADAAVTEIVTALQQPGARKVSDEAVSAMPVATPVATPVAKPGEDEREV